MIKYNQVNISVTSSGQEGVAYVPVPETPDGYSLVGRLPLSGTYNILVANSQESVANPNRYPIRYIAYQTGTWPILGKFFYIRKELVSK